MAPSDNRRHEPTLAFAKTTASCYQRISLAFTPKRMKGNFLTDNAFLVTCRWLPKLPDFLPRVVRGRTHKQHAIKLDRAVDGLEVRRFIHSFE